MHKNLAKVLLTVAVLASFGLASAQDMYDLTIDFTGMTPHVGQLLGVRVVDTELTTDEASSLKLELNGVDSLAGGYMYEGWALVNGMPLSTGVFNVNSSGDMVDMDGNVIEDGVFWVAYDLTNVDDIVVTIEPPNDTDPGPSATHYLGGSVAGGMASLSVAAPQVFGEDFSAATGDYILATPTNGANNDENSGIWWFGLDLPTLPAGWVYEGWSVIDGVPVTSGKFLATDEVDWADPYSDTLPGPPVPGEDYLYNAPEGLTFPTDLAGQVTAITIEPYPDDSPAPFTLHPLLHDIPSDATDHVTILMDNNAATFPTGVAAITNFSVADTVLAPIPSADFQLVIPGALVAGRSYNVDFFADLNMNGIYDSPPTDHAWRLTTGEVSGDVSLAFAHNTNFTDVMFPAKRYPFDLTLDFTGMTPHVGQKLQLRVIDNSLATANDTSSVVQLSMSGVDSLAGGYMYEGWAIINGMPVSTGKFNVNSSGGLVDVNGDLIAGGEFWVNYDLTRVSDIVLTIEPPNDADPGPSETHYLGGSVSGGWASMSVASPHVFSEDFSAATGDYILATPTNGANNDENSGIWWFGLDLPTLPDGWVYEGWVVIDGIPVTSGKFLATDQVDWSDPYSSTLPGPPVPGEDYLNNAPEELTFPTDLAGQVTAITIEPYPDDSPAPFTLHPLLHMIPSDATDHVTILMDNNAASFPTASANVRTYIAADTVVASIPAADFQLVLKDAVYAGLSYKVDFYADFNENGSYDAPPTDHAWRLWTGQVSGDVSLAFAHNTNFTDVMFLDLVRTCDFNGDGKHSMKDAIAFLLIAQSNPNDGRLDWNNDGVNDGIDVIYLLRDIWTGNCPDNWSGSTLLASSSRQALTIDVDHLTKEQVEYLQQMMGQLELNKEQEAEFLAALYGQSPGAGLPKAFSLAQNSPNPFNPSTTISYTVPEGNSSRVSLKVYDLRGKLVRVLADEVKEAGTYTVFWDGKNGSGNQVSSGIYFYRMQAGDFAQTRKMVILK